MKNSTFTVVYDACVLYPAPLRDLLMWLALSGRFRAKWSAMIHDEWTRNLLANRPDITREQLNQTVSMMNLALPDALVTDFEAFIPGLELPDPDDRHVLAAAIRGGATVIVTFNEKDFPAERVEAYGIEVQHPDQFIDFLFDLDPAAVVTAASNCRAKLLNPEVTVEKYLDTLLRAGLVQTSKALTGYRTIL